MEFKIGDYIFEPQVYGSFYIYRKGEFEKRIEINEEKFNEIFKKAFFPNEE